VTGGGTDDCRGDGNLVRSLDDKDGVVLAEAVVEADEFAAEHVRHGMHSGRAVGFLTIAVQASAV